MQTYYQNSNLPFATNGVIAVQMDGGVHQALVANGAKFLDPQSDEVRAYLAAQNSPVVITARVSAALQSAMDQAAQLLGYDDIARMTTYINSGVPIFKADAQKAIDWRDAVWTWAGKLREKVRAEKLAAPTIKAVLADMPKCPWGA